MSERILDPEAVRRLAQNIQTMLMSSSLDLFECYALLVGLIASMERAAAEQGIEIGDAVKTLQDLRDMTKSELEAFIMAPDGELN